jgi:hypothetical protein
VFLGRQIQRHPGADRAENACAAACNEQSHQGGGQDVRQEDLADANRVRFSEPGAVVIADAAAARQRFRDPPFAVRLQSWGLDSSGDCLWKLEDPDVTLPNTLRSARVPQYAGCNAFAKMGRANRCATVEGARK